MGDMQTMTEQKKRYTILGIFVAMFLFGAFLLGETGVLIDGASEVEIQYLYILDFGEVSMEGWVTPELRIYRKRSWQCTVLSVRTVINEAGAASGSDQAAE